MAQYMQPGVYLTVDKTGVLSPATPAARIPLIIGSGPSVLRKTIQMTRATSGQIDTFPVSVTAIESISLTSGGTNAYTEGAANDYTFTAPGTEITWGTGKGPTTGATYYVTVQYAVPDTIFSTPQLCTSISDVTGFVGPDLKIDSPNQICRVSLAAQVALNQGCPAVWVLPINPSNGTAVTATDYATALDNYAAFITSCWRVVPVDVNAAINSAVDAHVTKMSAYEERLERTDIYGAGYTGTLSTYTDVKNSVGLVAQSKATSRTNIIYPDTATMELSDGKTYAVDASILSAAFAGAEAVLKPQQSRTGMGLAGFTQLTGVRMKNSEMNDLATYGVTILTQSTTGANIIVRHQLTTDMSSVQNREASIQDIADTVARTLRSSCGAYIGKYNLTPDVITRISGTLGSALAQLKDAGTIISGQIVTLMQDATNPDTLVVNVAVTVPYPCDYIEITVALS